jgi:catalase
LLRQKAWRSSFTSQMALIRRSLSGPWVTKPPLDSFLTAHPAAKTFLNHRFRRSLVSYFDVYAFKFSNVEGRITFGRYQIRPSEGEQSLPPAEAKSA